MSTSPDPVAIVTGATGGIGVALAEALDSRGYHLVLTGFGTPFVGEGLAARLTSAVYLDVDLCMPTAADDVVKLCATSFGRLDLLLNNAGIGIPVTHADLQAVSPDFFELILKVNLLGPWQLTRAAESLLREGSGQVINISSVAGSVVGGSSIPYAVSKAGLEHMTRCLAVALGPTVRVNAIAPGYIETDRTRDWEGVRALVNEQSPARRLGLPEDVARAAVALADATYTTGAVIPVDGGFGLVSPS